MKTFENRQNYGGDKRESKQVPFERTTNKFEIDKQAD